MRNSFSTALGTKKNSPNVEVTLTLKSGQTGFAEASASLAMPEATPARLKKELRKLAKGKPALLPTAVGAFESACLMAQSKKEKRALVSYFGPHRKKIQTDITLSIWPLEKTMRIAAGYYKKGFRRFKLKVSGKTMGVDLQRIQMLYKKFKKIEVWIDANQGFKFPQAQLFIDIVTLNRWPLKAIEQPLHKKDFSGLKKLTQKSPFPIYADESAKTINDVKQLIRQKAVDGIVVKIAKSGLNQSIEMAKWARRHRKKVMISCMAESAKGLVSSVLWAIGDGRFDWVDLDSHLLTKSQAPKHYYQSRGPVLKLASKGF